MAGSIPDGARAFLGELAAEHAAAEAFDELVVGAGEGPMIRGNGQAYKGGQMTRLWKDWVPWHRSGDAAIAENWSLLTSRIRDLCRNDGTLKNIKRVFAKHVVGPGILSFSDVMDGEESDDAFNFESDDFFEYWAEHEADVEGKRSGMSCSGRRSTKSRSRAKRSSSNAPTIRPSARSPPACN